MRWKTICASKHSHKTLPIPFAAKTRYVLCVPRLAHPITGNIQHGSYSHIFDKPSSVESTQRHKHRAFITYTHGADRMDTDGSFVRRHSTRSLSIILTRYTNSMTAKLCVLCMGVWCWDMCACVCDVCAQLNIYQVLPSLRSLAMAISPKQPHWHHCTHLNILWIARSTTDIKTVVFTTRHGHISPRSSTSKIANSS